MSKYKYSKPVKRSRYKDLRRYTFIILLLVGSIGVIGVYIYQSVHGGNSTSQPVSKPVDSVISNAKQLYTSQYFQFQDTGQWVLEKSVSTADDLVYTKYDGQVHSAQLRIYINKVPATLDLQTPRVLPVRLLNDTHFQVTGVSEPCVSKYPVGQPHHITEMTINGAVMLCDPDINIYKVIISQIDGDYRLPMVRPNGEHIQFVITYQDLGVSPAPDSLINIAESFQTR